METIALLINMIFTITMIIIVYYLIRGLAIIIDYINEKMFHLKRSK